VRGWQKLVCILRLCAAVPVTGSALCGDEGDTQVGCLGGVMLFSCVQHTCESFASTPHPVIVTLVLGIHFLTFPGLERTQGEDPSPQ
jgi:hypothetical protein